MKAFLFAIVLSLLSASFSLAKPQTVAPPSFEDALVKLAERAEPGRAGKAERLTQYIEYFRLKLANDTRLFAFDVTAQLAEDGKVFLDGYVEFTQTRDGLVGYLEALGFDVVDRLEILPSEALGPKRFALVKTTHTLSYSRPRKPRSVVTDCLLGEPLFVLREEGESLLVHSGGGYLGYVAAADVYRVDAKAFSLYPTTKCVRVVQNHELDSGLVVPAGAILKLLPNKDDGVLVALPTGETPRLPADICELSEPPTDDIEQAVAVGKELLDTPYHWGGKTSDGIDCSGLVQLSYATCGYHLPRDSNQQFLLGRLTGTRWYRRGMQRGDTLYFLGKNGRIRHTALYLGGDRYLQAEMPAVNIRSLNPNHDDYDERRAKSFAFGKRLWQ
ncbi:MAG: C40 family peptidase [Planctomycetota bacterium]